MTVADVKTASRSAFTLSHLAIIIFHFVISCLLIFNRRILRGDNIRRKIFWIGMILGIATVLSLLPIYIYYHSNLNYVINMEVNSPKQ